MSTGAGFLPSTVSLISEDQMMLTPLAHPSANSTETRNVDVVAIHQWGSFGNFTKRTLFSRWVLIQNRIQQNTSNRTLYNHFACPYVLVLGGGGEKPSITDKS